MRKFELLACKNTSCDSIQFIRLPRNGILNETGIQYSRVRTSICSSRHSTHIKTRTWKQTGSYAHIRVSTKSLTKYPILLIQISFIQGSQASFTDVTLMEYAMWIRVTLLIYEPVRIKMYQRKREHEMQTA